MQQHLLITFVDWAKLIFCDGQTSDRWTDRLDCQNSDVDMVQKGCTKV